MSRDDETTTVASTLASIASSIASSITSTIATWTTAAPTVAPTEAPTEAPTDAPTVATTVLTTASSALTTIYTTLFSTSSTQEQDPTDNKSGSFIDENSSWFWYMIGGGVALAATITAAAIIYNRRKAHSPKVKPIETELREIVSDDDNQRLMAISRLNYEALDMAKIVTDHQERVEKCKLEGRSCLKIEDFTRDRFEEKMAELDARQAEIHRANEAQLDKKLKLTDEKMAKIDDAARHFKDMESKKYNTFSLLHESVEERLHRLTMEYCRAEGIPFRVIDGGKGISPHPRHQVEFDMVKSRIDEARIVFYDVVELHLPQIVAKTLGAVDAHRADNVNPRELPDKAAFCANALEHLEPSIKIAQALSTALENGTPQDLVDQIQMAAVAKYSEDVKRMHNVRHPGGTIKKATTAAVQSINDEIGAPDL